jgi:hypothetical protein
MAARTFPCILAPEMAQKGSTGGMVQWYGHAISIYYHLFSSSVLIIHIAVHVVYFCNRSENSMLHWRLWKKMLWLGNK